MEITHTTKSFEGESPKMTLKGYYQNLPLHVAPRYDFIRAVVDRCHVREQTVRNWILYGVKPQQRCHIETLSELTGIKEEDLWRD